MFSPTVTRRFRKFLLGLEVIIILVLAAGMGAVFGTYHEMNKLLPPTAALDHYRPAVGSTIWSSDGVLLARMAVENREPVLLDRVPKDLQNAMVAIEDSRFYTHGGLDFRGLLRATVANLAGGELSQGGSTITQQLARNIFLNQRREISRKIKEMLIALQIERNWTKPQILEAYLNQVYFGAGAYGVKAAARVYFGKDIKDLTLEESATLAGLPQRPSDLNPYLVYEQDHNYERTRARRNDVLTRMADLGFISRQRARQAQATDISVAKQKPATIGPLRAEYFVQYVTEQLREQLGYDQEVLDKTGLVIVTTLNYQMQKAAEKAMRQGINRYRGWGKVTEGALVCIDPNTGYVRAMVGGVNGWKNNQFNCATQAKRQPGSSFKLFVYATALGEGKSPYSSVNATASIRLGDGKYYTPKNHGRYAGMMSLVSAFASSVNGAAVNLCVDVGPRAVVNVAKRMGIDSHLIAVPALALGTSEVTPLELASAYGTVAAFGKHAAPIGVLQVKNQDGQVIKEFTPRVTDSGLTESTLRGLDVLTRSVVTGGTGSGAASVPEARGKTGTTEENTDAWFAGYVPGQLATVVWAGNRSNKPMSPRLYGGTICAPIWANFMSQAIALNPNKNRPPIPEWAKKPVERPRRRRKKKEADTNAPGNGPTTGGEPDVSPPPDDGGGPTPPPPTGGPDKPGTDPGAN